MPYKCEFCNFNCSKLSNYNTHLSTRKHKNAENHANIDITHTGQKYTCECGATYKYRGSLWNHKKKCEANSEEKNETLSINVTVQDTLQPTSSMEELITTLLYENKEIKKMLSQCLSQCLDWAAIA